MEPQCFLCKYWDINFSLEVEDIADCDSSFAFVVWEVEPIFSESSHRYRVNKYEGKDRSDSESTSRPHGVEVKLRPCIHGIYLTLFVQTLILFYKYFGIEKRLIMS